MKFTGELGKENIREIAHEFNLHSNIFVTFDQCMRERNELEKKQKEVQDTASRRPCNISDFPGRFLRQQHPQFDTSRGYTRKLCLGK